MVKGHWLFLALSILSLSFSLQAQNDSGKGRIELPDGLVVRPHAYGHFEAGQIEEGSLKNDDITANDNSYKIDHVWTEDADLEFGFNAAYRERLDLAFSLGAKLYFSYPIFLLHDRYTKNLRQDIYFDELNAQYHIGDADMPLFLAQVGYFKFKYNPDVRNLGEYLFRTGTYPIYFDMSFDAPFQRLLGFHIQDNFFKSLKFDALFTSSTVFPAMNWSLAFLGDYDVACLHFVHVGAGVDFAHLVDVYTDHSFPEVGGDPTTPQADFNGSFIEANGDTSYYTFKGTKVMGRISIDPKVFIPWKGFGENDLKLYAEADLIGVKSYPDSASVNGGSPTLWAPSYDNWREKMPVAWGFNFPAFKILDVLNVEMEWFGAKYYNDASNIINKGSAPLPYSVFIMTSDSSAPKKTHIKWSVYARKSFFNGHFALTGQVANDHMTLPCAAYDYEYLNELLVEKNDWWWIFKTSWMF